MRPDPATPHPGLEHLDRAPRADRWLGELVHEPFHERLQPDDPVVVDVGTQQNGSPPTGSSHTVGVATRTGLTEIERGQVAFMSRCTHVNPP